MKSWKKWLGRDSKSAESEPVSVDDLIILRRYAEAEEQLKTRLKKKPRDIQANLKLAEVYERTRRIKDAVEQYSYVADCYTSDGFFDKASAMLAKAARLAPAEAKVQHKLRRVERMRKLEQRLSAVVRALAKLEGQVGTAVTTSYLELRRVWGELSVSDLIDRLDDEQLGRLLKVMDLVRMTRKQVIAERGQQQPELYLLTRGKLEAEIVLPNGETTVLRSFEAGDLIGDRALFEQQAWPATYRVAESAVVLRLDRSGLEQALSGNPDPRTLLEALREKRLDAEVAAAAERLTGA